MGSARSIACNLFADEILKLNGFSNLTNEQPLIDEENIISLTPSVIKENHYFPYTQEPFVEEEFFDDTSLPIRIKNNSCKIPWTITGLHFTRYLLT